MFDICMEDMLPWLLLQSHSLRQGLTVCGRWKHTLILLGGSPHSDCAWPDWDGRGLTCSLLGQLL